VQPIQFSLTAATPSHISNSYILYNSVVNKLTLLSGIYWGVHPPVQCTQNSPYIPEGPPLYRTLPSSAGPVIHNQRMTMGVLLLCGYQSENDFISDSV